MSIAAEPTMWERVLDLLSDGDWHTDEEFEEIAHFLVYWIRELEESGYVVQRSATGVLRLLVMRPTG